MKKKEEPKKYKMFKCENTIFYKYNKPNLYIYSVHIFKHIHESNHRFRLELIESGEFETDQFIGYNSTRYTKLESGIKFSKEIELLAAPDEFIKNNNIKLLDYANERNQKGKGRERRKTRN